jgi:hypothetical protein
MRQMSLRRFLQHTKEERNPNCAGLKNIRVFLGLRFLGF